ncbi:MAG: class flavin-dependent oxidoreductase [Solirubrobacterales bacterium]|jgi:limonene 1,2-monooxygenase|nr:class flavin-dependent oxidoreductase [Solirubrobacterales bacterium]
MPDPQLDPDALPDTLRFGIFLPPYHRTEQNPTVAIHRDLELIEMWDDLGFDEVWVGEHHSGGMELIASPEQFLAAAAMRTRRIRLGTGVVSLPYHHPFMVAQRLVLLDHLSQGRAMLGVGPGALPLDATMLGIDQAQTRPRMHESLAAIMALLEAEEPISIETDWFTLDNAQLHLKPYRRQGLEVAVAAAVSPSGARLAGTFGTGLLSVGATSSAGFGALRGHWQVWEEQAAAHGHVADRSAWRLAGPMHIAETREQAYRDVEYGLLDWAIYFQRVGAVPQLQPEGSSTQELIEGIIEHGLGVIGTPDDAIAQIARLAERSEGFGTYMLIGHDWANPQATRRSYELFAHWVMPEFQGTMRSLRRSRRQSIESFERLSAAQSAAIEDAKQRYATQRPAR